jgi:hypothetical protein
MMPEQLDWVTDTLQRGPTRGLMLVVKNPDPDTRARRVERLPPSSHFTVQQAMAYANKTAELGNLKDVMIVGYRPDGEIYSISSHMSREWGLWLLHELMDNIRMVGRYQPRNE